MTANAVLVTGAASGIGKAVAARYSQAGHEVHGWDLQADPATDYRWSKVDVSRWDDLTAAARDLPPLAAVVTCAGIASRGPVNEQSPDEWRRVLAINVEGTLATGVAAFDAMRRGGATFVTIGSITAINGFHQRTIYSASKAAVVSLTRSLANEWAKDGIRTVCVSPGFTHTPMYDISVASGLTDPAVILKHTPQRALVEPEALADAIFSLTTVSFRRVTGAHLLVDAGWDALSGF
jgi:NAD(P)-dependent dehydrogenase (short-subunit alcohol dehydrogenase family)